MNDFSLIEKLKILMDIIISSPLFLFCFMIGIAVLILFLICLKKNWDINKWIFISIWIVLVIILIINYNSIVLKLIDKIFDSLFMALYFPSFNIYILIISISNIYFLYSLFNKKIKTKNKVINFINTLLIDLFLILIIDIVKTNNINLYDDINIYTNSDLLVLLELTSSIFISWILINLLVSAHSKLKKYDKKEYPEMPEIIFEEI